MTRKELFSRPMTAAEGMAELRKDPEFVARKKVSAEQVKRREKARAKEEAQLVAELREAGINATSVWDLVNTRAEYPAAIPVLIRHLSLPYSRGVKEGIARALTVDYAGADALRALVKEFEKEVDDSPNLVKWVLGQAIAEVAGPSDAETLIALACEKSHGRARNPIIRDLPRIAKDKGRLRAVLDQLMLDDDLRDHAELAKRKIR